MTVRPILSIGHPALRRTARPVGSDEIKSVEVISLISDLIETMRSANGAGLAAPQVGAELRIVVMEVNANPRYPYKPPIPLTVAINPTVDPLDDGTVTINEGCLSVPIRGDVQRWVNVRVSYHDADGVFHTETKHGLTAATWQHEVDHLDGILMIDRVSDPTTLATREEFAAHGRDAFVERITAFVDRVGS